MPSETLAAKTNKSTEQSIVLESLKSQLSVDTILPNGFINSSVTSEQGVEPTSVDKPPEGQKKTEDTSSAPGGADSIEKDTDAVDSITKVAEQESTADGPIDIESLKSSNMIWSNMEPVTPSMHRSQ